MGHHNCGRAEFGLTFTSRAGRINGILQEEAGCPTGLHARGIFGETIWNQNGLHFTPKRYHRIHLALLQ